MTLKTPPRPKLTLKGLLGRGYFPPELPPPFSTYSFARAVTAIRESSLIVVADLGSQRPIFRERCERSASFRSSF
jgi:hypothetical protein